MLIDHENGPVTQRIRRCVERVLARVKWFRQYQPLAIEMGLIPAHGGGATQYSTNESPLS